MPRRHLQPPKPPTRQQANHTHRQMPTRRLNGTSQESLSLSRRPTQPQHHTNSKANVTMPQTLKSQKHIQQTRSPSTDRRRHTPRRSTESNSPKILKTSTYPLHHTPARSRNHISGERQPEPLRLRPHAPHSRTGGTTDDNLSPLDTSPRNTADYSPGSPTTTTTTITTSSAPRTSGTDSALATSSTITDHSADNVGQNRAFMSRRC